MVREKFAKGSLGFAILVALLFLVVFNPVTIFLRLYWLIIIMPILAGLVIGFYAKGSSVARGKAGFKGVFAAMLILLLVSAPFLITAFSEIVALWTVIPLIVLIASPIVMGLLGFVGGFLSGFLTRPAEQPARPEEPQPPLPPPPT